jgi:polysaccharide export outer membrane protein
MVKFVFVRHKSLRLMTGERVKRCIFLFLLAMLVRPALPRLQNPPVSEYKIGPRDLLEIRVLDLTELANVAVRVSQDGTISLPLLKSVAVQGLTKDEVERKLSSLLEEKYLQNPQVSVFIREYQSQRVALLGAVGKPGLYELIGPLNLMQLISQAGGLLETASNTVLVQRAGPKGVPTVLTIDLEELWSGKNPSLNIPLEQNDIVNIPPEKAIIIFVMGQVKTPGAIQAAGSKGLYLSQAVAQAGGPTENAAERRILIKRKDKNGKETLLKTNLKRILRGRAPDIRLQDGDVVIVPESFF